MGKLGVFFAAYFRKHSSFLEFLCTKPNLEPRKGQLETHTDALSVFLAAPMIFVCIG